MRRTTTARRRYDQLSLDQTWELLLGPPAGDKSYFEDDDGRREAWALHGPQLTAELTPDVGVRPWGFWHYDHPGALRENEDDLAACIRLGIATPKELAYFRECCERMENDTRFNKGWVTEAEIEQREEYRALLAGLGANGGG